ncbi:MAG: peptide chain release factor family protein [Candidatus Kariarchaeaceae archaeon]|jgi:protein subunit release factor B
MKKELLFSVTKKDLVITWYKSGGSGGQKKNKTANACRIQHPDSGAMVTAQERRERSQNLKAALHRLAKHILFRKWVNKKVFEIDQQKTIDELVEEMMAPENLKMEIREDGKWKEMPQ